MQSIGKQRLGYLEGLLSAALNLVLFALKLWVGRRTGSVAMVADAWHTLSDILTSAVVVFGFWMSARPSDQEHPFGHGRAELIGAIVIGTLLGVVGANFVRESIVQLRERGGATFSTLGIVIFGASAVLKEGLALFSFWAGKKSGSKALIADGWHHRSDAIASAVIVIGATVGKQLWWLDGAMGLLVSFLILYAAFEVIRDSSRLLLGEAPDRGMVEEIKRTADAVLPADVDIHHIHMHRYGDHVEVTMHAYLPDEYSLKRVHDLVGEAENVLRKELGIEPTIHVDPQTQKETD